MIVVGTAVGGDILVDHGCELLLVVSQFCGVEVVVFEVGEKRHFAPLLDDFCGVNLADPGVE